MLHRLKVGFSVPAPSVRGRLWWCLGLAACSQSSVLTWKKQPDTGTLPSGDTAAHASDDGGTGDIIEQDPVYDDSGAGGDSTGGGADGGGGSTWTWDAWTGARTYSIARSDPREGDCTGDTVSESGLRIEDDLERWQDLCRICSEFYTVTYAASSACSGDIDLSLPEVRGVVVRGSALEMWRIRQDGPDTDVEIEFNDASWADGRADFRFDYSWNGDGTVTVDGFLQLDEEPTP